eukprot:13227719-Alexandrium_andersonii.AAC.1
MAIHKNDRDAQGCRDGSQRPASKVHGATSRNMREASARQCAHVTGPAARACINNIKMTREAKPRVQRQKPCAQRDRQDGRRRLSNEWGRADHAERCYSSTVH